MPTSITIRGVPDEVRDELAARANLAVRSLREHLKAELIGLAQRPTVEVVVAGARDREARAGSRLSAKRILAHRGRDRPVSVVVDASVIVLEAGRRD